MDYFPFFLCLGEEKSRERHIYETKVLENGEYLQGTVPVGPTYHGDESGNYFENYQKPRDGEERSAKWGECD